MDNRQSGRPRASGSKGKIDENASGRRGMIGEIGSCPISLEWPRAEKGKYHYLRKSAELPVHRKRNTGRAINRWKDSVN